MNRAETLERAKVCVCGDREEDYGSPEDNFSVIAALWESYIKAKCVGPGSDVCICADDVAIMQALLKIGRIAGSHVKDDNYIDLAGYAACAAEIATGGKADPEPTPVDMWTEEDEEKRMKICNSPYCMGCKISSNKNGEDMTCGDFCKHHPAEARQLIAEMEAEHSCKE